MGNQAGIIIRNVKNELFHSAKRLILNEVKGIECLHVFEDFIKLRSKVAKLKVYILSNRYCRMELKNKNHTL